MKPCSNLISQMTSKRNCKIPKVCCNKAVEGFFFYFISLLNSLFVVWVLLAREISWPNFVISCVQQKLCGSTSYKSQRRRSSCDVQGACAVLGGPRNAGPCSTQAMCLELSAVNRFAILAE